MERAAQVGRTADQAAGSAPVFGIELQHLSPLKRSQNLLQSNSLFNHFRVGMQSDAVAPSRCL